MKQPKKEIVYISRLMKAKEVLVACEGFRELEKKFGAIHRKKKLELVRS
jgi:hypothetical protein